MPCSNVVSCGLSMARIIEEGMNAILNENVYPELEIRAGIDVGESAVIQYGLNKWSTKTEKKNAKGRITSTKQNFEKVNVDSESWSFIDYSTGNVYRVYMVISLKTQHMQ